MKKSDVVYAFRSVTKLSRALSVSRATIYTWPEILEQKQIDLIVGAATRLGVDLDQTEPEGLR